MPGNLVYFITQPNSNEMPGITKITYTIQDGSRRDRHPLTADIDDAVRTGVATAAACRALQSQGVRPDLVIGHNGWGETLFVKDIYPDVPLLSYFEFFYRSRGADVEFDPEFAQIFSDPFRLRTRNAMNLLGFQAADWGHTATSWQRSLYPPEMQQRITVMHEGVDTEIACPDANAWIEMDTNNDRLLLGQGDEVITYCARNLEPYRGFHMFMRALPEILRRRPNAHAVIVGGDGVSYGSPPLPDTTYREMLLREVGQSLDFTRVHFVGQIPYSMFLNLLQVSSVHVYLTYPFVLSWSFVEALSCGCLVIGSATAPVLEFLTDRVNGLTVDFFAPQELTDRVDEVLQHPTRMLAIRRAARRTAVEKLDLRSRQLPRWQRLIDDVANGRRPRLEYP